MLEVNNLAGLGTGAGRLALPGRCGRRRRRCGEENHQSKRCKEFLGSHREKASLIVENVFDPRQESTHLRMIGPGGRNLEQVPSGDAVRPLSVSGDKERGS